ncbi:hypothetical protein PsorP6_002736 [Peronosclerospora sorghi]|uniref:Uncharacterized protein n=1 Tax=Peronosclerospora sorghi TaxID=230839 RepID=A0ACC0WYQ9_9STRA|nr:hypothetical protein PsorP6_002736 [Peronosclerospora sorghi]
MPLLHAIGRTGIDTTFTVDFIFLSGESTADFLWALQHIASEVYGGLEMFPRVIVTDADGGLRSAIEEAFPRRMLGPNESVNLESIDAHMHLHHVVRKVLPPVSAWSLAQKAVGMAIIDKIITEPTPHVSNPAVVKRKGRPVGAKNKPNSSVKRDPSAFEVDKKKSRRKKNPPKAKQTASKPNVKMETKPGEPKVRTEIKPAPSGPALDPWHGISSQIKKVPGDGHCGYYAVGRQIAAAKNRPATTTVSSISRTEIVPSHKADFDKIFALFPPHQRTVPSLPADHKTLPLVFAPRTAPVKC